LGRISRCALSRISISYENENFYLTI
jgi:hypothetical protein